MTLIVIAAAGKGSRLESLVPKPLFPIGGVPNIERILRSLESSNLPIAIVIGHKGEEICNYVKQLELQLEITFVINEEFATSPPMTSYQVGVKALVEQCGKSQGQALIICADLVISKRDLTHFVEVGVNHSIAGVSSLRSVSGLGVDLNDMRQIVKISREPESPFEWGNFASLPISVLQQSTDQVLSELVEKFLPFPGFLVEAIDIDTPDDVVVANQLVLGWRE
jgi:NDP-sugar pyrophosphorylase family protein